MLDIARNIDSSGSEAPPAGGAASAAPAQPPWSHAHRIGFRFAFSLFVLWLVPFPVAWLGIEWPSRYVDRFWNALVSVVARAILHLPRPLVLENTGSGDRTADWICVGCWLVLAAVATAIWSIADRRRHDYARLDVWLRTYVRFALGATMLGYGFYKVFHSQMPFPTTAKLEQPIGDSSPMGLLWTFMGYSKPYSFFTGFVECIAGALLLFRRTATLGALVSAAALVNVVLLNFCYDVAVKLFSSMLLLTALFLAAPRLRALFDVLVGGRAVAASAPQPLFARRRYDRMARRLGIAFAVFLLVGEGWTIGAEARARRTTPPTLAAIAGEYDVVEFVRDGRLVPPLLSEASRWRSVSIVSYKKEPRLIYRQIDDHFDRFNMKHDPAKKTLTPVADDETQQPPLSYAQPDADHLTLLGPLDGHALEIKLRRRTAAREFRLLARGFHLISDTPYNR
jgi:hypothetical protein